MQRHTTILAVAMALALAVPAASAGWGGRGFFEPDTERDRLDGYMWADADVNPDTNVRQVYFNAFAVQSHSGTNPNFATTGSHVMPAPSTGFYAMLGVWKDCNSDGYIGAVESAFVEYRAELLLDTSICPPGVSPHNDGEWVAEFLWIGPDAAQVCEDPDFIEADGNNDDNPITLSDPCARVWADIGLPEDGGTITCPVRPLPRGTLASTGGLQRYADCIANYRIYGAVNTLGAELDGPTGLQISQTDAPRERPDQSESVLNQKSPYGAAGGDEMVTVWDCTAPGTTIRDPTAPEGETGMLRTIGVRDPTDTPELDQLENSQGYLVVSANLSDEEGGLWTVYSPAPGVGNLATGTPAGTINQTLEGAGGDCDRSNGSFGRNADVYDAAETDFEAATPLRRNHDVAFAFREGVLSSTSPLGPQTPAGYGVGFMRDGVWNTPLWTSSVAYLASRNGLVDIDTGAAKGPQYWTFYAYVSLEALSMHNLIAPNGGAFEMYGSDHCAGTAPITGLWDCDEENWWRGPNGEDIQTVWQIKVGQVYNFRDIDCYDETYIAGQPVTWGEANGHARCAR